jgi:hypothetical protein
MLLTKKDSLALIHKRLDSVSAALTEADALTAAKNALQANLTKLRAIEVELLASDDTKPQKLAAHRAEIDLLTAKIERSQQTVLAAEEAAVRAAEVAGVLIYAFKNAAIESYYATMEAKTREFFDSRDLGILKQLSGRSAKGRSIHEHEEFHFQPSSLKQRAVDLHDARLLALAFEILEKAAAELDFGIDIPPQWLD